MDHTEDVQTSNWTIQQVHNPDWEMTYLTGKKDKPMRLMVYRKEIPPSGLVEMTIPKGADLLQAGIELAGAYVALDRLEVMTIVEEDEPTEVQKFLVVFEGKKVPEGAGSQVSNWKEMTSLSIRAMVYRWID
jgi:hypothetical protein